MNTQNNEKRGMTLREKTDIAGGLCLAVSLSALVFIRRRIGYRLLDTGWYLGAALAVYLIGLFSYDPSQPFPHVMEWYALAVVIFGAYQRMAAWRLIQKGTQPHSYSTGLSIFETRRTVDFIRRNQLTNRIIDPLMVFIGGLIVKLSVCDSLGNWLILTSSSMFVYELLAQRRALERNLDVSDSLVEATNQADAVRNFGGMRRPNAANEGGASVPTGLGADIKRRV